MGRKVALALVLVALALTRAAAEPSASRSLRVLAIAKQHLGTRYVWGGASPAGFDCSGFVMYVYAQVGVALPHNAAKQYRYGTPVIRARLEPGDVVFFDGLHHNGIYVGDGRFIHARRRGGGVTLSSLDESWYRSRWSGGRRF
jgi:cell wall-associated NlpC family hydrolase